MEDSGEALLALSLGGLTLQNLLENLMKLFTNIKTLLLYQNLNEISNFPPMIWLLFFC